MGLAHQLRPKNVVGEISAVEGVRADGTIERVSAVVGDGVEIDFAGWMRREKLSVRGAAEILGISKDSVMKYRDGGKIPKMIRLAVWALERGAKV